ncbi:MOSC domain-containing protein [Pseudochryseolinea flava]|uniref:MOSC domain-containing protein n=1 Tax=Pseudochryseolinea flava TaxID=2059302 RepID=A0A364XYE7_9BACT|nr:MOSC N-terminal beta barrel domain-containing protein [Pseudochryseolinea flava]RAV99341.1 MOSC domain-containing protein [Pseudochryseolinea flava]
MGDLKLSEIWIYPVKSLGGIQLTASKVLEKGLPYDRRWMLVDENNVFMTQRVFPQMALFKLALNHTALTIRFGADTIDVPLVPKGNNTAEDVVIWDDHVMTCEVDTAISQWFSYHLQKKCKLMFFPEDYVRPVDPKYKVNDEQVSLADAYPFLIIGENALQQLNDKLASAIGMDRFRPNFVFSGGAPHEEDTWREFVIGTNRFVGVKPCARCAVPTINQETAEKGIEPTKTLAKYRARNNKIYFGQNLVARDQGEIKVGDSIQIVSYA